MSEEKFKEAYNKGKVWADLDRAIEDHLGAYGVARLRRGLEVVKLYTGLDMRQDFLLGLLRSIMKADPDTFGRPDQWEEV